MKSVKIDDLPIKMQDVVRAKLGMAPRLPTTTPSQSATPKATKGPTKTELDYARIYLAGLNARYEAITLRLDNGHRYTPDWVYWQDGQLCCVEVKGSYRLGSYQRARLAFDQARLDFPDINFTWAERKTDGGWKMELY